MVTAGDLIRSELAAGNSQLGLARRLAGTGDAAEVTRWRYVVQRAAKGSEPHPANVARIEEVFGQETERPLVIRRGRLAALEAEVLGLAVRLESIEAQVPNNRADGERALRSVLRRLGDLESALALLAQQSVPHSQEDSQDQ